MVLTSFSETYEMPRKKRVEGAVLDLTGMGGDAVDIEALLAAMEEKPEPKRKAEPIVRYDISDGEIRDMVRSRIRKCEDCKCNIIMCRRFNQKALCYSCYIVCHSQLSQRIDEYMTGIGMTECNICKKKRVGFEGFHFDHINMFNKDDNVGLMIARGVEYSKIIEEISKCQLLCIHCHAMVTAMEIKLGFLKAKRRRIPSKEGYSVLMTRVYEIIKEEVSGLVVAGGASV